MYLYTLYKLFATLHKGQDCAIKWVQTQPIQTPRLRNILIFTLCEVQRPALQPSAMLETFHCLLYQTLKQKKIEEK